MTHPAPPACLTTPYSSKPSQKGGTLIAEDIVDLEGHRRRLADPDGYRPERCGYCGVPRPHGHGFRERVLLNDPVARCASIRRYLCSARRAVWQVLPALIARHLHRGWEVVQSAVVATGELASTKTERRVEVPGRTTRRWAARLRAAGIQLSQLLAAAGEQVVEVLGRVGVDCCRAELVDAAAAAGLVDPARKLGQVAAWIHRLVPGIRLM